MVKHCRAPVWLKTAFAVLMQEGGGIGAQQGKTGAKVGPGRGK